MFSRPMSRRVDDLPWSGFDVSGLAAGLRGDLDDFVAALLEEAVGDHDPGGIGDRLEADAEQVVS